ncbi:RND superfamily putative drug exporter [Microbacterium sp. SORGH_AS428]|uniref:MMPL family transporter n=1 Tax=Microbacterium sp. SORGH_AS_0428 TaxID=3041788 RepID=UPI0028670D33|nr:MMPL family transporter [Microbacterium sp. SORGH_AS_0428]MDR6198814.1 RND superfamily putative drug exporter [Microbacterium sp. SORGH_AS_0428]
MSSFLFRVGRFAVRWRWAVIAAWLVLALGGGALSQALGGTLASTFEIPGTPSQQALDQLQQRLPQLSGASARVVIVAPSGTPVTAQSDAIATACEHLATVEDVAGVTCPVAMSASGATPASSGEPAQISRTGEMAFITVQLSVAATDIDDSLVAAIEEAAQPAASGGATLAYSGLVASAQGGVDWTEIAGMAIAFVVLAITFGAVVAAGVPLVTAVIGVTVASSSILIVAAFAPVSSTAPLLATMLGLAVGIDYALLIVSRHRAQLAEGMDARESIAVAIATAGTAVVFAGLTVMIALLGLAVAGIPFLTVMGLGAAGAVLAALAVAVTLLPAVLAVLGRAVRPRVRHRSRTRSSRPAGWVRLATRTPVATIGVVVIALMVVATPALSLRLTLPDAGYDPPSSPARIAYDLLDEGFGPGFNGPLLITADISGTLEVQDALDALDDAFSDVPDVVAVSKAFTNEAVDLAVLSITPASSPSSDATTDLVRTLRDDEPAFAAAHGFGYAVTGQTALAIDISDRLGEALLPFGIVVVGLCLVLLTIMFRSIAVPLSATVGYLLSVAAALGVTSAVFEWGWAADLLGVGKVGPVISFLPILVMAVLFGLAMDYHVFLVSRMREHYAATGDAHGAVLGGFSASARVVTAAALIMFSVFFSFVPGGNAIIQPLATALAAGVLIDAFVVRMTLIPAIMALLGHRAWWLPAWLGRLLPDADIEGEAVERMRAQRTWLAGREDGGSAGAGVLAHGVRIGGEGVSDLVAPRGAVVLVEGPTAVAARFVAAVAGRTADVEGDLVVHGYLLPFERAAAAAHAAYVPAAPERADASSLAEHLRRSLRAEGVGVLRAHEAVMRAAATFDALLAVVSGTSAHDVSERTPMGQLSDAERWAADVAVAATSGLGLVAIDLGDRAGAQDLAQIVVRAIGPGTTIVLGSSGAVLDASPQRPVVRVDALARATAEGGRR